jgi:tetratricopeptide (TPR) repeat protein
MSQNKASEILIKVVITGTAWISISQIENHKLLTIDWKESQHLVIADVSDRDSASYYNRGVDYTNQKEWNKAIAEFDRAIELNSNLAEAYGYRGFTYFQLQDWERAINDFNRAIFLKPKVAEAFL